ncbi:hypothetical protein HDV01_003590 [Terramyces sp. JEL0728]|nr:hypothetical protein HDV01_003590 [Terramyces sp. JEL0728]
MISGQGYKETTLLMIKNFLKKNSMETALAALEMECHDDMEDIILPDKPLEAIIEEYVRRGIKPQKKLKSQPLDINLYSQIGVKASNCKIVQVDDSIYARLVAQLKNLDLGDAMEALSLADDNRFVIVSSFKNTLTISTLRDRVSEYTFGKSPILSISAATTEILVSFMDGSICLLDFFGNILLKKHDHSKYANRCLITPNYYVTGSYDQYVNVYSNWELNRIKFSGIIEAMASAGDTVYVGVRGEDCLYRLQLSDLSKERISINGRDDGHVSFNAMDINIADSMVAVYTDSKAGKIIVLKDNELVELYGVSVDEYSRSRLAIVGDSVVCTSNGIVAMNLNGENEMICDEQISCVDYNQYLVGGGSALKVWTVNNPQ